MRLGQHISLALAACLVVALCFLTGPAGLSWPDFYSSVGRIVLELRLARVLSGFVVGAALACSGCALQTVLRNPLAEPYVLGISSGSSLGAALAIMSGLSLTMPASLPSLAFLGGLLALAVVWGVGGGFKESAPAPLILTGVITGTLLSSIVLLLHALDVSRRGPTLVWWMMGNLHSSSWGMLAVSAALVSVALGVLCFHARELNALLLGFEQARVLGVRTRVALPLILGGATLATAAAVAMAGIIGFVGLVVPHALRRVTGANHRYLLPHAILCGGAFLVLSDTIARVAMAPRELPVGVVTALMGGPFFLYLMTNQRRGLLNATPVIKGEEQPLRPTATESAQGEEPPGTTRERHPLIALQDVSVRFGESLVLSNVCLRVMPGERIALTGANGSGKTSLLRVMAGQLPVSGSVRVMGEPPGRRTTKAVALVPQDLPRTPGLSGWEYVMLGRTAYLPRFGEPSGADREAVLEAMRLTSTLHLGKRPLQTLSGGERQRLAFALALAVNPAIMLLDEPTSHLDLNHRARVMALLESICHERGITLIMVAHDLMLASQFFDRVIVLGRHCVLADGAPREVLRPEILESAFGCAVRVVELPGTRSICVLPVSPAL